MGKRKNNVRCKGYAAKFKTNQNSRALLMSEHVRENHSKNSNNDSNNNLNIENNNVNINNNSGSINLNNNNSNNINNIPLKEKGKEKTESDFNDAPDLTQKKKNIRPLNGFRPATPPLKDAFTQQNSSSNQNYNNIFNNNNNNDNNNKLSIKNSKNKIESLKSSQMNNKNGINKTTNHSLLLIRQ